VDRHTLSATIARERAALDDFLAGLDDARMTAPRPDGGWCVKDHIAHIAAWERMIVAHLHRRAGHQVAAMDGASYVSASLDDLNARLHVIHANDSLDDVRRESVRAHLGIVACIRQMPEARYDELYWGDDSARRRVLAKIEGDTYLHYREHLDWIRQLLQPRDTT